MAERRNIRRVVAGIVFVITLLGAVLAFCDDEPPVTYENVFEVDFKERHKALWMLFENPEQSSAKLNEQRSIRAIFVGRYKGFEEAFAKEEYERLSLYRSPFQVKIFLTDYYLKKFLKLKLIDDTFKMYLAINDHKKNYFNLYPRVYTKKKKSNKKSIIPNKLFNIDFFVADEYIDAYQELFDSINTVVRIKSVETVKRKPDLLDKTTKINIRKQDSFLFYKTELEVNEVAFKKSFEKFFDAMKTVVKVEDLTEFYHPKYFPARQTPLQLRKERIVSVNVLYDPDADFDYEEMEIAKKAALVHFYLFRHKLARLGSESVRGVQEAYNAKITPDFKQFKFEDEYDEQDYLDLIDDFYLDLDYVLDFSEEVADTEELTFEIIKLTATINEIALEELIIKLKEDTKIYR